MDSLIHYKASDKGRGEIAADIMAKAVQASDDLVVQTKLGLKAFLRVVPAHIGREFRRKHFGTVREALAEARFLQRVHEEESLGKDQVLAVKEDSPTTPSVENNIR